MARSKHYMTHPGQVDEDGKSKKVPVDLKAFQNVWADNGWTLFEVEGDKKVADAKATDKDAKGNVVAPPKAPDSSSDKP